VTHFEKASFVFLSGGCFYFELKDFIKSIMYLFSPDDEISVVFSKFDFLVILEKLEFNIIML